MLFVGMVATLIATSHHDPLRNNINDQLKAMKKAPVHNPIDSKNFSRGRSKP